MQRARPLYWRCFIAPEPLKTAMRIGDWKILADEPLTKFELYNVQRDPRETTELSATQSAKFAEMNQELINWGSRNSARPAGPENRRFPALAPERRIGGSFGATP